jgi:hypothetical protein
VTGTQSSNGTAIVEAEAVRPLPARRTPGTIELFGREVPVATAATAGAAAAALIAVRKARKPARRVPRRGLLRRREKIVARRSFLVDVHVLGR